MSENIIEEFAKVDSRGGFTIPAKIRKAFSIEPGEQLRVEADENTGTITLHQQVSVDKEQAWFWTSEWQKGEREAEKDVKAGKTIRMKTESMLEEMKNW
ncbi:MAG: AbrB/MazE/SpoVT family DNA-binding domain-containing protein [Actinobacteria bacterium]|nr:AbrB/MazE/SpoVT family DNA-binding domain-containing protein [Actinomycetota bacterium]